MTFAPSLLRAHPDTQPLIMYHKVSVYLCIVEVEKVFIYLFKSPRRLLYTSEHCVMGDYISRGNIRSVRTYSYTMLVDCQYRTLRSKNTLAAS